MLRPSGTVTLLFSDIEGSSALWERAPDSMAPALELHDTIVRSAVESEGGYVFKTAGDAFCVAFPTGPAAARAAAAAQSSLGGERWPERALIRVRMAIHTGVCQERDNDYFGPTVNRTARLMAIAHGGQVLVSGATEPLLADSGRDGLALRDLGLHRLRDLGRPEHVFQLIAPALADGFPPLRSLDNADLPNNLPLLLSSFVGRDVELTEVRRLLGEFRMLTVTGAGGAGKTRLAIQAAAELLDGSGDGVWLVELAPLRDENLVATAILGSLGIPESEGDSVDVLLRSLLRQRVLIVLDNCEHLIESVAKLVDTVIRRCPEVHILATSREPLGIDGERVYRVPSMSLPHDDLEHLTEADESDAVALFSRRAVEAGIALDDRDAAVVGVICRRLDGIPLALELAVAQLSTLSLQQLADRLDQRFRLLTGGSRGAMERQQTLQALVDWSYDLLGPSEKAVLERLSVFAGSFDLEAAEAVCAADDMDGVEVAIRLRSLVDKSLVVAEPEPDVPRFRLLESIRQYAAAAMLHSQGERGLDELRDRHAAYYVDLAVRAEPVLTGLDPFAWLRRLDLDWDNLRTAMEHLGGSEDGARGVLTLAACLRRFITSRLTHEVIPYVESAVETVESEGAADVDDLCCSALLTLCSVLTRTSQLPDEMRQLERHATRARKLGSSLGRVDLVARATWGLGIVALTRNELDQAVVLTDHAVELARESGDRALLAEALYYWLDPPIARRRGLSLEEQRECALEILRLGEAVDVHAALRANFLLATIDLLDGDLEGSRARFEAVVESDPAFGGVSGIGAIMNLFYVQVQLGDYDAAVPLMRQFARDLRKTGFRWSPGDLVEASALIAAERGDALASARLLGASGELKREAFERGELISTPSELVTRQKAEDRSRAELGPAAFDAAYEAGRALGPVEATELAISVL